MNKGTHHLLRTMVNSGALRLILSHDESMWIKMKNGRKSPYMFNTGDVAGGADISTLVDACAQKFISLQLPENIVLLGPPYKGIPLTSLLVRDLWVRTGLNYYYASWRKESKDHGEGGTHLGRALQPGDSVILLDDVITDGGSKHEAVKYISASRAKLAGLMVVFDRQERASDTDTRNSLHAFAQRYRVPVYAVATLADLMQVLRNDPELIPGGTESVIRNLKVYYDRWGAIA